MTQARRDGDLTQGGAGKQRGQEEESDVAGALRRATGGWEMSPRSFVSNPVDGGFHCWDRKTETAAGTREGVMG